MTLLLIFISLGMLASCLRQPDKAALQVELHDAQEQMQGTIVEYIHGMSVVKVFNRTLSAFGRGQLPGLSSSYSAVLFGGRWSEGAAREHMVNI